MTDHNITEIADARYMGLMCPPASPQAKALVNNIINIIEQAEQRKRVRKAKQCFSSKSRLSSRMTKKRPRFYPRPILADIQIA
jgi:hypothetical protein